MSISKVLLGFVTRMRNQLDRIESDAPSFGKKVDEIERRAVCIDYLQQMTSMLDNGDIPEESRKILCKRVESYAQHMTHAHFWSMQVGNNGTVDIAATPYSAQDWCGAILMSKSDDRYAFEAMVPMADQRSRIHKWLFPLDTNTLLENA